MNGIRRSARPEKRRRLPVLLITLACLSLPVAGGQPAAAQTVGAEDALPGELLRQVQTLVYAGGGPAMYADEDAVVIYRGDRITLAPDGRVAHRTHSLVLLLTERAIDALGDPRVPFDTLTQQLTVHRCRTYTPDGRVVDATGHAFNRVTPGPLAHCADRIRMQEMVITHVGIERGCAIELDVEVSDTVPHQPWLEGRFFLQESYPVLRRVIEIRCPSHLRLMSAVVGDQISSDVQPVAGSRHYRWEAAHLAPVREHDDRAGGTLNHRYLLCSTCPTWEYLGTRLREATDAAAQCDSSMRQWLLEELDQEAPRTLSERLAAVVDLSAGAARGGSFRTFNLFGMPRPAARTFATACGSDWDRLVLALALLRAAGADAALVLRGAGPTVHLEVPALVQFDRLLVRAELDGESVLLDPAGGTRLSAAGDWAYRPLLDVAPGEIRWTPAADGEGHAIVEIAAKLSAEGVLEGSADLRLAGRLFPHGECVNLGDFLESYAGRLAAGAELLSHEVVRFDARGCHLRFRFRAQSPGEIQGDRRYLSLIGGPVPVTELLGDIELDHRDRSTPIFLGSALFESVTWNIALPAGREVLHLPEAQEISSRAGVFRCAAGRRRMEARDADPAELVTVSWTLELPMPEIPPARLAELQRAVRAYRAEAHRLVILSEGGE